MNLVNVAVEHESRVEVSSCSVEDHVLGLLLIKHHQVLISPCTYSIQIILHFKAFWGEVVAVNPNI